MESIISPLTDQLYDDIFNKFRLKFGKRSSSSVNKLELFKSSANDFIKDLSQDLHLGNKVLNNAYTKTKISGVLSGETFVLYILKNLLGETFIHSKKIGDCLKYGNDLIKDMFLNISRSCVNLYSRSILENKNGPDIKAFIREEIISYFDKTKVKYGLTDIVSTPQVIGKDYKTKYKALKKKYKELESKKENRSLSDILDV